MTRGYPTTPVVRCAVEAYNAKFGHMDAALWTESQQLAPLLMKRQPAEALEAFAWKIKSRDVGRLLRRHWDD